MIVLVRWLGKIFGINITTFGCSFKRYLSIFAFHRLAFSLALLVFHAENATAGFERIALPPRVFARGLSPSYAGDIESLQLNPSAVAALQSLYVSAFHSPSPFDLSQISNGGVLVASPLKFLNVGLAVTSTGFSLYRELTATATLAKELDGRFFIGCNINYDYLAIANYGTAYAIGIDVAASVQVMEDLRWGFSLLNVNRPTIGELNDELPQVYLTGITCELLTTASVFLNIVKDVRYPVSSRMGVEFSPYEIVSVRFGLSNEPSRYFGGIGIHYSSVSVDYAVATHLELGLTHSFGISFGI
jgi:hypothetical protein